MKDYQGPQTARERAIASDVLRYMRRAGPEAAAVLLRTMTEASDDGASREELEAIAFAALASLPAPH